MKRKFRFKFKFTNVAVQRRFDSCPGLHVPG